MLGQVKSSSAAPLAVGVEQNCVCLVFTVLQGLLEGVLV